jgi:UDP-N-acetylglucosamine--N-acetylmuramyl-(pentapeptide) pyrophosphoryl-undecaprenol N-acetylglucosamine transferase
MLIKSCWQAAGVLRRRKPQVVLGMGGFVAGPGGLMAKLLRIPLVIHEQNRVPGTTNRLLTKLASVVLEGFPRSFPAEVKARYTGNPLRAEFQSEAVASENKDIKHLLVLGGSLGAAALNETVPQALAQLPENLKLDVIHQSGQKTLELAQQHYADSGVKAEIKAFIEDMVSVYRWADLVICRAGAMTISELAATGTPSILVPLPHAIDDHQTRNAEYLADADAAVLLRQSDMNVQTLTQLLSELLGDESRLQSMQQAALNQARVDATQCVARICLEVAA